MKPNSNKPVIEKPVIYKIVSKELWIQAKTIGEFVGASIDLKDGYIHFSTAEQAEETARKHFAGQEGLWLVAIDSGALELEMPGCLRWEPSRGGALFPHLYGALSMNAILWESELPWSEGSHHFPVQFG